MKKQIWLLMAAVCFTVTTLMAQEGRQKMTPEERTKASMEKMAPLNLDAESKAKTEVILTEFYSNQQKAMEDMRASGSNDKEAFKTKRKELTEARDAKLKLVFTEDQFKKWTDEIEPSLRPQRPAKN